ncbi:dystrobrevin-1-like [Agrilus planipennis]|uniref:Dystrobrevin n=1 Tax=Agrilus planipennis TaxID=224129 RepID=A0A7F5RIB6_AGRPL|nr:dystrobrevin-1-like [Agrilus planipennis]
MQSSDGLPGSSDHRLALVHEMSSHNFDLIRFASYRTAVKLRFIQKKVSLHTVDIWNVIEAFREQGLHTMESSNELSVARLETLLCSLYHSLNKRAPPTQQTHVDVCSSLLLNWLLAAYATVENVGKIRVFSIKVALATLCAGKLMDKLRYIFSQISDSNGLLIMWKFNEYLEEVLALPAAVYESPTFSYTDTLASSIFNTNAKVTVNDFLDTMMSDVGPPALVWLPLLHRITSVENVVHPVQCDACQRENFTGFRYRCQKCPHYTLCQECFWRGRVTSPHTLEHQMKEYVTFSPTRTISHSLRKSFRCVPDKQKNNLPRFPEQPEKTLNLSHIVPPSPIPSHNGFPDSTFNTFDGMGSLDSRTTARSLDSRIFIIINRRRQQELECSGHGPENPALMTELRALRMRKDELEAHLTTLQDSRRQLMIQLEGLMKMLKNHQSSPRSTPNSSPRSTKSPPLPQSNMIATAQPGVRSAPQTPMSVTPPTVQSMSVSQSERVHVVQTVPVLPPPVNNVPVEKQERSAHNVNSDNVVGVGDVRNAFGNSNNGTNTPSSVGRSLRNDLLVAADSVTNAMSTLVRELNSETSLQIHSSGIRKPLDFEDDGEEESEGGWQQELQKRYAQEAKFMEELRARNLSSPSELNPQQFQNIQAHHVIQNHQNFGHIQKVEDKEESSEGVPLNAENIQQQNIRNIPQDRNFECICEIRRSTFT